MNYKLFSLVSGTLILSSLSASGQKNNTKPNILFILCDDMGYGDLGMLRSAIHPHPPIWMRWQARVCASHRHTQEVPSVLLPELHL